MGGEKVQGTCPVQEIGCASGRFGPGIGQIIPEPVLALYLPHGPKCRATSMMKSMIYRTIFGACLTSQNLPRSSQSFLPSNTPSSRPELPLNFLTGFSPVAACITWERAMKGLSEVCPQRQRLPHRPTCCRKAPQDNIGTTCLLWLPYLVSTWVTAAGRLARPKGLQLRGRPHIWPSHIQPPLGASSSSPFNINH